jgi:hypothetical protein
MAMFEFQRKRSGRLPVESFEAESCNLDVTAARLTFYDIDGNQIAAFGIENDAWVRRARD